MSESPGRQLELALGDMAPAPLVRRKRRRRARRVARPAPRPQAALLAAPVTVACGFCGRCLTILEEVAPCPACGSLVSRPWEDD